MALSDHRVGATVAVSDMEQARSLSPEHAGKATATVATWEVPDIEATVEELASNDVVFERYDEFEPDQRGIHSAGGQGRIAWFKDPEGNTIAVGQFG